MATKISALTAAAAVTGDDLVPIVNDPAGTPVTQKATAAQVKAYVLAGIATGTITALTDDINFSGGSDGDVLTKQADGSLALETPSGGVGGSGDMLSTLTAAEIAVTGAVTATISRMHVCSGTTADYTVTLPAAAGNTGKFIGFRMATGLTKLVTLDGDASETIDGALTRIMWAGESAILLSDGANWFKVSGKSLPMIGTIGLTANQTGVATATITKVVLDRVDDDNTGMMVDTTNKRLNIKRPGDYNVAGCVVFSSLTAAATRCISQVQIGPSGSLVAHFNAEAPGSTGSFVSPFGIKMRRNMATTDLIELYAFHNVGANQTLIGVASGSACFVSAVEVPKW